MLKKKASKSTLLFICRLVAPIDDKRPNCFVLSLTEMENALYIKDMEPNIIIPINTAARLYNTELKLRSLELPV